MAISIKKSSSENKQTVTSSLPEEVQTQIANNLKLDITDYTTLSDSPTDLKETVTLAEVKGKRSDDVVQLKFSKGKRAEAKAFTVNIYVNCKSCPFGGSNKQYST